MRAIVFTLSFLLTPNFADACVSICSAQISSSGEALPANAAAPRGGGIQAARLRTTRGGAPIALEEATRLMGRL